MSVEAFENPLIFNLLVFTTLLCHLFKLGVHLNLRFLFVGHSLELLFLGHPRREVGNSVLEAFFEVNLRLPSKELAGLGDIGLSLLRIVRRKWLEDNLGLRVDDVLDSVGKLKNGVFSRVSDVDRAHVVSVHKADESIHLVVNVAEAASLVTLTVNGDGLVAKRLDNEVADNTAIIFKHARTVGVEDTGDADLKIVLAVVLHAESFGDTLAFIVARSDADRVDISPVFLNLRVDLRISVHFRGGSDEESGLAALSKTEHVHSTEHVGLDSFDGVVLVEDGGGRARKVVHLVNFKLDRVNDVMANELEARVANVLVNVGLLPREAVVHADDLIQLILEETVDEVGTDETSTTSNQNPLHRAANASGVEDKLLLSGRVELGSLSRHADRCGWIL